MKILKIAALVLACLSLVSCKYLEDDNLAVTEGDAPATATAPSALGTGPEQVWIDKAKEHFKHGEYGLAERYFRRAVEERYANVEAWLGLAASYDRLKRFDEAGRAYEVLRRMAGDTPTVLNNLGFHYMLKGEFDKAERALHAAEEKAPHNPLIKANLALLADWKSNAGRHG